MPERKQRKNETTILSKLDDIIDNQSAQATEIAVIKTKSEGIETHLGTLNGKVATQEGRQQASDNSVALITQSMSSQQRQIDNLLLAKEQEEAKKLTFWERNADKLFWLILAAGVGILFAKF